MGIWDFLSSTTEAVKQRAPDPTPLKEAYKTSYDFCSAAAGKIDNVARVNSQRFKDHMSDEETRAQIGLYTSKFLQNAAQYGLKEGYKFIPGGEAVAKIVSDTRRDVKLENQNRQEMEAMKKAFGDGRGKIPTSFLQQEWKSGTEVWNQAMSTRGCQSGLVQGGFAPDVNANQSPRELLNNFMMNEFMGKRSANELVPPQKNVKKI